VKLFHLYNQDKGGDDGKNEELLWLFESMQYKIKLERNAKIASRLFMFKIYFDFGFKIVTESSSGIEMMKELQDCSNQRINVNNQLSIY
jgi:hypothetical protein